MWLRDLLPVATPISRIMSYGYDAKVYQSRSTLHIMHKAQDLLYEIKARRDTPSVLQYLTSVDAFINISTASKPSNCFCWTQYGWHFD